MIPLNIILNSTPAMASNCRRRRPTGSHRHNNGSVLLVLLLLPLQQVSGTRSPDSCNYNSRSQEDSELLVSFSKIIEQLQPLENLFDVVCGGDNEAWATVHEELVAVSHLARSLQERIPRGDDDLSGRQSIIQGSPIQVGTSSNVKPVVAGNLTPFGASIGIGANKPANKAVSAIQCQTLTPKINLKYISIVRSNGLLLNVKAGIDGCKETIQKEIDTDLTCQCTSPFTSKPTGITTTTSRFNGSTLSTEVVTGSISTIAATTPITATEVTEGTNVSGMSTTSTEKTIVNGTTTTEVTPITVITTTKGTTVSGLTIGIYTPTLANGTKTTTTEVTPITVITTTEGTTVSGLTIDIHKPTLASGTKTTTTEVTPITGTASTSSTVTPVKGSSTTEGTTVSGATEGTTVSGATEGTAVSGATEGTTVSGATEVTTVSGATKGTTVSGATEGTTVSGATEGTSVSDATEGTTASGATEGTTVSGETEGTTVSGTTEGTTVSGATEGTTISGATEGTTVSGATEGTTVSGATEGTTVSGTTINGTVTTSSENVTVTGTASTTEVTIINGTTTTSTGTTSNKTCVTASANITAEITKLNENMNNIQNKIQGVTQALIECSMDKNALEKAKVLTQTLRELLEDLQGILDRLSNLQGQPQARFIPAFLRSFNVPNLRGVYVGEEEVYCATASSDFSESFAAIDMALGSLADHPTNSSVADQLYCSASHMVDTASQVMQGPQVRQGIVFEEANLATTTNNNIDHVLKVVAKEEVENENLRKSLEIELTGLNAQSKEIEQKLIEVKKGLEQEDTEN